MRRKNNTAPIVGLRDRRHHIGSCVKKESYVFENSNPLYIPLFHLLKGEEELIIDDDETDEINKKYMRIYLAEDSSIKIDFINDLEKDDLLDKFSVFVKNIGSDYRSKVDYCNMDTKERLFFFFEEVYDLFEEEYHQVTIEENLADNGLLTKEESKKYVKELSIFKNKDF